MVINASLEILKDQVRDGSSWRTSISVMLTVKNNFMARNQSILSFQHYSRKTNLGGLLRVRYIGTTKWPNLVSKFLYRLPCTTGKKANKPKLSPFLNVNPSSTLANQQMVLKTETRSGNKAANLSLQEVMHEERRREVRKMGFF